MTEWLYCEVCVRGGCVTEDVWMSEYERSPVHQYVCIDTVGAKTKFTFRFRTTVVLRYEPSSKNRVKLLLRKCSTHRFYGFRTGKTHVHNSCIACQTLFI